MKLLNRAALLIAALAMTCAPSVAQNVAKLPDSGALDGTEKLPAVKGTGCATNVAPCATVAVTAARLGTYIGSGYQPSDADLTAIAALATQSTGRSLLAAVDAAAIRTIAGVPPASRLLATTAPLAGGGDLSADRTLSIAAATTSATGSMSAADKTKLDGIASGATANTGTVTAVATTIANGLVATVSSATTTPLIAISGANLTPTTVVASGAVSGSNITTAGNVIGNAATATKLATARTIAGASFDGSANITIADTALTGVAWSTYTPVLSCGSGTVGSASAAGRYKLIGKIVFAQVTASISSNGTCTNSVTLSLPFTAATVSNGQWILAGRENALTGKMLQGVIGSGSASVTAVLYDGGYSGGTGALLNLTGLYEVP